MPPPRTAEISRSHNSPCRASPARNGDTSSIVLFDGFFRDPTAERRRAPPSLWRFPATAIRLRGDRSSRSRIGLAGAVGLLRPLDHGADGGGLVTLRPEIIGAGQVRRRPKSLGENHVAAQRLQNVLPGPDGVRPPDLRHFSRLPGAQDIRDQAVARPVAPADHIAGARAGHRHALLGQERLPIAGDADLARGLARRIRIVAAEGSSSR